jgi:hypothetical protein
MEKIGVSEGVGQERLPAPKRPPDGTRVWMAIDISRSKAVYCLRWEGSEQRRLSTPMGIEHVRALLEQYRGCQVQVAYEACGFGYELAWWLQAHGVGALVIAPSRVERVPGLQVKTDRVDVGKLARKLEKGDLKAIYIPSRPVHEQRQLGRTYAQSIKERKRAQVRIRSLLQEQGRLGPLPAAGWKVYRAWLGAQNLPQAVRLCVQAHEQLRAVADQQAQRLKAVLVVQAGAQRRVPAAGEGVECASGRGLAVGDPLGPGTRGHRPLSHHRCVAPLLGADAEPVQLGRVGSSGAHAEVWAGRTAGAAAAVCVERRPPRGRSRLDGMLQSAGSPHWSQTSDRGSDQETGDQGARALAYPPGVQPARAGGVSARAIRRHRLTRELELDLLRAPSWSTTAHRTTWTLQSLAGVDRCEAPAAATNNNLVGVPSGRTRMAEWPVAAGEAEREKTTPLRRLAVVAAPPPPRCARCTGYSREWGSSTNSEGENGRDSASLDKDRHGRG